MWRSSLSGFFWSDCTRTSLLPADTSSMGPTHKKRAAYPKATQIPYDPKFSNIKKSDIHGERIYSWRTIVCIQNVSTHGERFYSFRTFLLMENDSSMKNNSAMEQSNDHLGLLFLTDSLLESTHPLQSKKNDRCIEKRSQDS